MFDFSFSEIALIGVVALVVIGPERLPKVARTTGVIVGRVRRYAAAVQADIAREVELSELRQVQTDLKQAVQHLETEVQATLANAETQLIETQNQMMASPVDPQSSSDASSPAALSAPSQPNEPIQQDLALEIPAESPPIRPLFSEAAEKKG
jgi:sec-independent protein translocase protein TatB